MAKGKTTAFFCKECGYETSKWLGQCPGCKEWNTFVEELVTKKTKGLTGRNILESKPVAINEVDAADEERISNRRGNLSATAASIQGKERTSGYIKTKEVSRESDEISCDRGVLRY